MNSYPHHSLERGRVEKVKLDESIEAGQVLLWGSLLAEPLRRLLRHAARLSHADAPRALRGRQGLQDVEGSGLPQQPLELDQPQGEIDMGGKEKLLLNYWCFGVEDGDTLKESN